jgi:hypothetical protein
MPGWQNSQSDDGGAQLKKKKSSMTFRGIYAIYNRMCIHCSTTRDVTTTLIVMQLDRMIPSVWMLCIMEC